MEPESAASSNAVSGTWGRVVGLWRYPVKSMLGEERAHLDVNERGVEGDRFIAVRDPDGKFGSGTCGKINRGDRLRVHP